MSLSYKGITDFIKHLTDSDPRLHEGLNRVDDSLGELYKSVNDIVIPDNRLTVCRMGRQSDQTIVNNTVTTVDLDLIIEDKWSQADLNADVVRIRYDGFYILYGYMIWDVSNSSGERDVILRDEASNDIISDVLVPNHAGNVTVETMAMVRLKKDQTVKMFAFQNSGLSIKILGSVTSYNRGVNLTVIGLRD